MLQHHRNLSLRYTPSCRRVAVYEQQLAPMAAVILVLLGVFIGSVVYQRMARGNIGIFREWLRREAARSQRYREIFENAIDAVLVHDLQSGIILDCNRSACATIRMEPRGSAGLQRDGPYERYGPLP